MLDFSTAMSAKFWSCYSQKHTKFDLRALNVFPIRIAPWKAKAVIAHHRRQPHCKPREHAFNTSFGSGPSWTIFPFSKSQASAQKCRHVGNSCCRKTTKWRKTCIGSPWEYNQVPQKKKQRGCWTNSLISCVAKPLHSHVTKRWRTLVCSICVVG